MATTIVCPVCGETNPADMEFCRNCQSRLHPLSGSLQDENAPIQPGEPPTKKVTSELEPLLPQWLRDARQQARESAAEGGPTIEPEQPATPASSGSDLLAGLASQAGDEDEEIPEWLANITGATSKKKKPVPEDNQVKWVELGRREETKDTLPESPSATPSSGQVPSSQQDNLTDWFKQAAASSETADFSFPPDASQAPGTIPESPVEPEQPYRSQPEDLSWLRNLDAAASSQPDEPVEDAPPARAEVPDWLKKLQAEQTPPPAPEPPQQPASLYAADVPDWLRRFGEETPAPNEPETVPSEPIIPDQPLPDWLKPSEPAAPQAEMVQPQPAPETPIVPVELPDWISALGQAHEVPPSSVEPATSQPGSEQPIAPVELPGWLSSLGSTPEALPPAVAPAQSRETPEEPIVPIELPDWISSLGSTHETPPLAGEAAPSQPVAEQSIVPTELPDWISSLGKAREISEPAVEPPQPQPAPDEPITPVELPDWISSLGKAHEATLASDDAGQSQRLTEEPILPAELPDWMSSLDKAPETPPPAAESVAGGPAVPAELSDWMSSLRADHDASAPPAEPGTPAFQFEPEAAEPPSTSAAFTQGGDVDAIFASMEMPDWLSTVAPNQPAASEESAPPAAQPEEPIVPADLPSWVQAMRPVESAMTPAAGAEQDALTEERGPLAGLQGVLPALPGAALPSSKPKSHSIKLDATEQQQAHAALLEQILAAETSPIPMRSGVVLRSQRALRWALSFIVILVVGAAVYMGTQMFPLPGAVPNETVAAIRAVQSLAADAPVLVVFDYQPSTVGEMEATGSSLMENLLLLKHPRLALLSTSPTGPALAERFMSTAMPDLRQAYQRDGQYVNLGYLPGGLAGVYNFAQNPRTTMPLDANSRPAWQSAILGPVVRFSDFAAVIVLTDSVESGRTWIEQSSTSRGNSLMIIVSSAQAGPILLPYVDSGQVNGLVSGMNGAVGAEQANPGLPGVVRRYWDAYSIGLYLAVLLIVLGGLGDFLLGIRDRRSQAVE